MPAKVKLATFPYQQFGTLEGEVIQVAPNSQVDQEEGLVFATRLQVQPSSAKAQQLNLLPEMAATAEIVIRKRSILSFLLEPILDTWNRAFSTR